MITVKDLLQMLQNDTYECSVCHKMIYPTIIGIDVENETISTEIDSTSCRGGIGNKVIADNICNDCIEAVDKSVYTKSTQLYGTEIQLKHKYGRFGLTDDDIKRGHWNGYDIVVLPYFNVEEVM